MTKNIALVKDKYATLFVDGFTYIFVVVIMKKWWLYRNRKENITIDIKQKALKCNYKYSTTLKLCQIIPASASFLLKIALKSFPVKLSKYPKHNEKIKVSIIIGHRGTVREPLLKLTLSSLFSQSYPYMEIIVVEYDYEKKISIPEGIKYAFCECQPSEPYNRARAFNVGAKLATGKYLVFHDNDMLVPLNYVEKLVYRLESGFDFVNEKRFIFYLDRNTTNKVVENYEVSLENPIIESVVQNLEAGGSVAAIKESYFAIGGMDESYVGWGGEDDEFWDRAATKRVYSFGSMPIIHLWHEPQKEKSENNLGFGYQKYLEHQKETPESRISKLKSNTFKT